MFFIRILSPHFITRLIRNGVAVVLTAKVRGSNPGQVRNLDRVFCYIRIHPLEPQHRVPEPVPSLETHLEVNNWMVDLIGEDTSVV